MQLNKEFLNVSCIYGIRNKINNKIYVGKTINLLNRLRSHRYYLRRERPSKNVNSHLFSAWKKYGEDNFECFVIEHLPNTTPEFLAEREVFWILEKDSMNSTKGYNQMAHYIPQSFVTESQRKTLSENIMGDKNPNWGNYWPEERKKYMSDLKKQMFKDGVHGSPTKEQLRKGSIVRKENFIKDPKKKQDYLLNLSKNNTKYEIYQLTKQGELIKIWSSVFLLLQENPTYKRHNIYAVCSGEKPSIYGYKWKKVKINDIVQS